MMNDTLRRPSQLVEINRKLADDLDSSRQATPAAERERDRLIDEFE